MTKEISNPILRRLHGHRGLIFPLACIGMLMVLLVPLPPAALDLLLVVNITLSVIILVTTIYVHSPLEFAVFPSLLLAITMFRLVLNVATTRLILSGKGAEDSAGHVVQTFSGFVTSNSVEVGAIIFLIIFIIQFVVITKGGSRISEVAARFVLDAMPGKQMAIDADLNSGAITEPQARHRREKVAREAEFYGAMDGASKFVRGDAIAGVIIVLVNIVGGICVGMFRNDMSFVDCLQAYTKLTIGDGLVSQVPAFIVSLGAGLIVTRSSSKSSLGEEVIGQMVARPAALLVAAAFLALLSLTGLPKLPLLVVGACCGGMAYILARQQDAQAAEAAEIAKEDAKEPENVEKLLDLDAMELEVGYGLIKLVDAAKGGDLPERVTTIRRKIATELGIIVPPVRIRDNPQLDVNDYAVKIKGQTIARGVSYAEQFLAIDTVGDADPISGGDETTDPASRKPAYWITESQCDEAEGLGYAIADASAAVASHLTEIIRAHAHELLTRQAVRSLLDNLKLRASALVEEVVPTQIKPGELQKILQNLLRERVPVRDLETILETIGDFATRTKEIDLLTEYVRGSLARTICKQYVDEQDRLWCITLDPAVEQLITGHLERSERGIIDTMPPRTAQRLTARIGEAAAEGSRQGKTVVVLCSPHIRAGLRRMIEPSLSHVAVLAINEIAEGVSPQGVAMLMDERAGESGDSLPIEDGYESASV